MQKSVELDCNGLKLRGMLHVPDTGEGKYPFVAMYHGITGHKAEHFFMFVRLSRALEKAGIGSVRFDFSGSGESDGLFEEMTVSREAMEAKAIFEYMKGLEYADGERLFILGMSMGGLVASLIAPELQDLKGMVLWAPAGSIAEYAKKKEKERKEYIDELGRVDIGGLMVGPDFYEDIKDLNAYEKASKYKGEVLIIHGTGDMTVPVEASYRYMKAYEGNAGLVEIEGADHVFSRMDWREILIGRTVEFLT